VNLRAIANGCTSAVNPNVIGSIQRSAGYAYAGDAQVTGSITGSTLDVTAVASGSVAVGSIVVGAAGVAPGTNVLAFGSGEGGVGTYTVAPSQTVESQPLTLTGSGQRVPIWTTIANVPMQFQALTSDDLKQLDGLNISAVKRAVHLNGIFEGVDRPGVKGGDLLLAPTGLSGADLDTWLVVQVLESFEASGWCRVAVTLQAATQSQ
jgi:hypothetical protein